MDLFLFLWIIYKSISITYHTNKLKDQDHKVIWSDAEKTFDKIQDHFIIKVPKKLGWKEIYINIVKAI